MNFFCLCATLFIVVGYSNQEIPEPNTNHYLIKERCQEKIQDQIDKELHASLVYLAMAGHFKRNDISKEGFAQFFEAAGKEEYHHASKLIEYLTMRGSRPRKFAAPMPTKSFWTSAADAFQQALELEKEVLESIHEIHYKAEHECKDPHLMDFLESEFMDEQIKAIDELIRYHTKLQDMESSNGLGEYLLDREILNQQAGR